MIHHIIPVEDLEPHVVSESCWCFPLYRDDKYIHNAKDVREQYERIHNKVKHPAKGWTEVLEKDEITFFAPTDWSIQRSMRQLNNYWYNIEGKDSISQITQIKPEVWKELLSLYVVEESYLAKDIPQLDTVAMDAYAGQAYVTLNGRAMNMGIVYHDANGIKYAGYRQLLYSYVNDFGSNDLTNAYVATSDIQPTNGVVHVLRFIDHNFGFNETLFISKAIASGIEAKRE